MANIEERVESLLEKEVNNLGYYLYDVEYVKEGKDYFLRIYIDNENGISLEDCEKVSNCVTEILDKADYIKEQYFLEVSSPGVERILRKDKHFEENLNQEIEIKLFRQINGTKELRGILKGYTKDDIIIQENEEITIDRKQISQIKTIYNWENE